MEKSIDLLHLANLVRQRINEQGLTLREAAERSDISFSTLSRITNCKTVPDMDTWLKLKEWLGKSIDKLMMFNDVTQPKVPFSGESIEVHFRGKGKNLEASSPEVKKTLIKMIRFAHDQFSDKSSREE